MSIRRKSREAALQFLFQDDFKGFAESAGQNLDERFVDFCSLYDVQKKARPYAVTLLKEVFSKREEVDATISQYASNWRLPRIDVLDRNVLRIATCEMLCQDDVPPEVAINEAVEIAKRFCGPDSPAFVNGILDAVRAGLLQKKS